MEMISFGPQLLYQLCWVLFVCLLQKTDGFYLCYMIYFSHPWSLLLFLFKAHYIFNYFILHAKTSNGEGVLLTLHTSGSVPPAKYQKRIVHVMLLMQLKISVSESFIS